MLGISSDDLRGFLNAIRTYEWWHLMLTQSSEKDPTHLKSPALHKQGMKSGRIGTDEKDF